METKNKIILIAYCVLCSLFILIVPWRHPSRGDVGYSFITTPPLPHSTIDIASIVISLILISIITAIVHYVAKRFF